MDRDECYKTVLELQREKILELEEHEKITAGFLEVATQQRDEALARIAELEAALKDCADELEAWIDETYKSSDGSVLSQCKFQYDRDIITVRAARAAYRGEKE